MSTFSTFTTGTGFGVCGLGSALNARDCKVLRGHYYRDTGVWIFPLQYEPAVREYLRALGHCEQAKCKAEII